MALLSYSRTCIVPTKCVAGVNSCKRRLLDLSTQVIMNVLNLGLYVSSGKTHIKNKLAHSSLCVTEEFTTLKGCETQIKVLFELCIAPIVGVKNVSTFQPFKSLEENSKTAKSAKEAVTCLIFLLSNRNRQECYSMEMVHIALQARRVVTTKQKSRPRCCKSNSANHNQLHPELIQKKQKAFPLLFNRVEFTLVDTLNQNFFACLFVKFQSTLRQYDFPSFQRKVLVISYLWTTLRCSGCKKSGPGSESELPGKSSASMKFVIVSKTTNC